MVCILTAFLMTQGRGQGRPRNHHLKGWLLPKVVFFSGIFYPDGATLSVLFPAQWPLTAYI